MKVEIRAQQITIDAPRKDAVPFVAVVTQRIIYNDDDTVKQRINRERVINRSLTAVSEELHPYSDPVTGGCTENISGLGLSIAISSAVAQWMVKEYQSEGAEIINGQVILNVSN